MVFYELGIIFRDVPIISKQYYKEYGMALDPTLRTGFLSALMSFASEVFSDEIDSFIMKNFKIVILSRPLIKASEDSTQPERRPHYIIVYGIGNKKLKLKTAKKALTKVLEEFLQQYGTLENWAGDIDMFAKFLPVFDEILGDLAKKPDDRLRSLFR
ncbi:MAG: hypothetical protein HWN66_01155 [Candidatus Helarchaeota archaeon]|nr:hypothetical protein [Candidatus Helarchaeota archaeon]